MKFDIGIVGAGVAGSFAALKFAENHKDKKVILIELGRGVAKRRRFLEGWLGCLPNSDGKIYTNDIDKVQKIADGRSVNGASKWFMNHLFEVNNSKLIKNKSPSAALQKKIKDAGFELTINDYYQWKPESIHQLSRYVADKIEAAGNVSFSFDNEVYTIEKFKNYFSVSTADGNFKCKKLILCAGRTGWRWVNTLYKELGILISNDNAKYGIRVEISGQYMKELNKSHCTLTRDDLIVGPFSWGGSIVQEDHADLTIAAFRSNEERWKSDKVFFSVIGKIIFKNEGCQQADRLGKLAFLLFGDRVGREKIKIFIQGNSQLKDIPEYNWLNNTINELNEIIPTIISRGYYHCPELLTTMSDINLKPNLESEIDDLFIAGESAGISGIAAAGIMGVIAAEGATK